MKQKRSIRSRKQNLKMNKKILELSRFPSENPYPVLRVNLNGILLYANNASLNLLQDLNLKVGFVVSELITKPVIESIKNNSLMKINLNSNNRFYTFAIAPVKKSFYANLYGMDVTTEYNLLKSTKDSLEERELLIRELYHRTKNNMTLISSLISIQASYIDSEEVDNFVNKIENRLHAMSMVHQMLYESNNLSEINLKDYIVNMFSNLLSSFSIEQNNIEIDYQLSDVYLSITKAIPCGLILNELFINTLKYAFPDNTGGKISVYLDYNPEMNNIDIIYSDNGIGIPADLSSSANKSFGLNSIDLLVKYQLQGNVVIESKEGFKCAIRFGK